MSKNEWYKIGSVLAALLITVAMAIVLSGCSTTWHIKQSEKHYKKAIYKGYKPKEDTFTITNNLQPIRLKISDTTRYKYIEGITNIITKENPLNHSLLSERNKFQNRTNLLRNKIDSILSEYEQELDFDTTISFEDGYSFSIQIQDGKISAENKSVRSKEKIYVNPFDAFLEKIRWYKILGVAIVILVIIIAWRALKKFLF